MRKTESRLCQPDRKAIGAPGAREDADCRGAPGALRQQVGQSFRGKRLGGEGILDGPGPGLRGREVAPGHDGTHGVVRRPATCGAWEGRCCCTGSARFFALLQERRGVIGVCDVFETIGPAGRAGQALVS